MYTRINMKRRLPEALAVACMIASIPVHAIEIEQRSLSSSPPAKVTTPTAVPTSPATPASTSTSTQKITVPAVTNPAWDMFQQLEEMRASIARLQGTVEEQQQLIERLQSDLRTRYTDLDQRMEQLAKPVVPPVPAASVTIPAKPASDVIPSSAQQPSDTPALAKASTIPAVDLTPEELNRQKTAYLAAYQSAKGNSPAAAISLMSQFLETYPDSVFAPNAYYWLGDFQLRLTPADLVSAEANFQRVLRDYGASPKVASASYKLGMIASMQGKPAIARDWMLKVINQYPKSEEARLAQSFVSKLGQNEPN